MMFALTKYVWRRMCMMKKCVRRTFSKGNALEWLVMICWNAASAFAVLSCLSLTRVSVKKKSVNF